MEGGVISERLAADRIVGDDSAPESLELGFKSTINAGNLVFVFLFD